MPAHLQHGSPRPQTAGVQVRTILSSLCHTTGCSLTEAGYSTLVALLSPWLEAARAAAQHTSRPLLECVKCRAQFRAGPACPLCGSTMVIEIESRPDQERRQGESAEEEEVSLGIPACELLDLASLSERAGTAEVQASSTPRASSPPRPRPDLSPVRRLSVKADIHIHSVGSVYWKPLY